jgi:hypothetical protein
MGIRVNILEKLDKNSHGMIRLGATGPGEAPAIEDALSGDLENAGTGTTKRAIPKDYKYDPSSIKPMAKMLWSMSVSLGHALSAHKTFVRLKSSTISPDGLLGGRGYVMAVKDVRAMLHDACEALSALCDTIHDEINAPHWQPKLGQLEKVDIDKIKDLLSEAQDNLDDPEDMVKEEEDEAESGHAGWHHPAVDKDNKSKKDPKSDVPGGGDYETNPQAQPLRHDMRKAPQNEKQASVRWVQSNSSLPVETMPGGPRVDHLDRADSDQTGPFGTYNRDENMELSDKWRRDEGFGNDYNYPSDWENDLHEKMAYDARWSIFSTAAIPDSNSDPTHTEGWDFGIGDGNGDEATGQGAGGYGEGNPGAPNSNPGGGTGNMGVYGPSSGLPKDFGGAVNPDEGDSNLTIENEIGGKGRYATEDPWAVSSGTPGTYPLSAPDIQESLQSVSEKQANWEVSSWYDGVYDYEHPVEPVGQVREQGGAPLPMGPEEPYVGTSSDIGDKWYAGSSVPGDNDLGVARTDYFDGRKPVNMQNTAPSNVGSTKLPGEQMPTPPKPLTARPSHNQEHMFATGELPGDDTSVTYDYDTDLGPDMTNRFEQQNVPYIKWDDNTHEMRPDVMHQRDPITGPYVHNDLAERPHG